MKKTILQIITISGIIFIFSSQASAANHDFTGLPLTVDGWTDFEAMIQNNGYQDSRVVFVSSSTGNDDTGQVHGVSDIFFDADGIFQSTGTVYPYATMAMAYSQMRDGHGDIMLLKRGDEWNAGLGVSHPRSGALQQAPHIIASYGASGARPKLIDIEFNTSGTSYFFVSGLHFYSADWQTADRALDIRWGTTSYQTYEDLYMEGRSGDIVADASNIVLRRCIWKNGQAHDGQLFIGNPTINLLLEENLFFEPYDYGYTDLSRFGRHIYSYGIDATMRNNIFYASDRGGPDLRWGIKAFQNNLLVQSSLSAGDNGSGPREISAANIYQNVFVEGSPRTGGSNVVAIIANDGSNVYENIFTDPVYSTWLSPINIRGNDGSTPQLMVARNISFYNNIVYAGVSPGINGMGFALGSNITDVSNISVTGNQFQFATGHGAGDVLFMRNAEHLSATTFANNKYYSSGAENTWFDQGNHDAWVAASGETGSTTTEISYADPSRTIRTYNVSLGGNPSTEEFMAQALLQSRANWRGEYTADAVNNYIRAGFETASYRSDVDNSGGITTTDALLTLRNSLGLSMNGTAWQPSATTGDVNCDGNSNSTDALLILRHSLGLNMSETGWCE